MRRKYTYPFLMMVAVTLIFLAEKYLDKQEKEDLVEAGATLKSEELSYFLPTAKVSSVVHHQFYSLNYNETAEQASWVAYTLQKDHLIGSDLSRPYFDIDAAVATGAADWRNYKNSGYDRGHLVPAGDRRFSTDAYTETFLTSNISPQLHGFNSGVWNRLEHQVRDWAEEYGKITILTAGILENPIDTIGDEKVYVPRAFYKIVIRKKDSGFTCLAFLIPHRESTTSLKEFVVTVDELEQLTAIDFFPQLEDSLENRIEKRVNIEDWTF